MIAETKTSIVRSISPGQPPPRPPHASRIPSISPVDRSPPAQKQAMAAPSDGGAPSSLRARLQAASRVLGFMREELGK